MIPSCNVLFVLLAATAIKPAWKRRIDHFRRIRSIVDIDRSSSQAAVFHHHRRRYAREDTKLCQKKNRVRSCSHRIGRRRQQIKPRQEESSHASLSSDREEQESVASGQKQGETVDFVGPISPLSSSGSSYSHVHHYY